MRPPKSTPLPCMSCTRFSMSCTCLRRSRMALRASSSPNSACAGGIESTASAITASRMKRNIKPSLTIVVPFLPDRQSLVDDVGAAILRPSRLVMTIGTRPLFAVADGLDLLVGRAEQREAALHRVSPLLTERQVVLAAATFVGVAFDHDMPLLLGREVAAVRFNQRLELATNVEPVELEEHAAFCERAVGIGERIDFLGGGIDALHGARIRPRRRCRHGRGRAFFSDRCGFLLEWSAGAADEHRQR